MNAAIAASPARVRSAVPTGWSSLVRTECWRVARHPAFLVGVALTVVIYALQLSGNRANPDRLSPVIGATFIGLVGMALMSARARAQRQSAEVVESAPMSATARTAALCVACLVPFAAGLALWGFELWSLHQWPLPRWQYAGFSDAEHAVILWTATAVPTLGGPLLGVAAGRWLRFRGATVVVVVGVVLWVLVLGQATLFAQHVPTWATAMRLSSPYAFFQTQSGTPRAVDAFPGSPWWYAGWQLALCAMAVIAALLKDGRDTTRRRLLAIGWAVLGLGLVAYVLAFTGGFPDWLRTFPDGTTQWGVGNGH